MVLPCMPKRIELIHIILGPVVILHNLIIRYHISHHLQLKHSRTTTVMTSVFRICEANVQGLDVQEVHIRARSKSERAPMKTFMYVQNLELRACTPLVPGIFWPRKIQNFGAPGMNAGVRSKHERIRTNTFTYDQVLDVHGKY